MLEDLTPPRNRSKYCKVADTLEELSPDDRAILQAALDDTNAWAANTLSTQLTLRGVSLADVTITKHRRNTCACHRR
jgi:hypothetical protein